MAILKSLFPLSGPIGEYTFYRMKGSDRIIVRRKGGPSRLQLTKGENFAHTRLNNREFGGRVKGSQLILRALAPLHGITNCNIAIALHKTLKAIQELDTSSPKGERNLRFSQKPMLLEGMTLNTSNSLESVIRTTIPSLITPAGEATLQIPELNPRVNLMLDPKFPYFRLCAVLAAVPDLHVVEGRYASPLPDLTFTEYVRDTTPWLPVRSVCAAHTFRLAPEHVPSSNNFVWMLSLGVEVGFPSAHLDVLNIQPVPKQGAGKVIRVVAG